MQDSALAQNIGRLADAAERLLERDKEPVRPGWAPEKTGVAMFLQTIPGLAARFQRHVPPEFIARTAENADTVACPCGAEPTLSAGELAECGCGRWFLHAGGSIRVTRTQTDAE